MDTSLYGIKDLFIRYVASHHISFKDSEDVACAIALFHNSVMWELMEIYDINEEEINDI